MSLGLTVNSTPDEVSAAIFRETKRRNYSRAESVACDSTAQQESSRRPAAVSANGKWRGIYQQDTSYPGRDDPNLNILAFLDRLDVKRASPGASSDPFKNIFWLQQRPSEPSADVAYDRGRRAYYTEIRQHILESERRYDRWSATPPPATSAPSGYGMPRGSNSGGYGGNGVRFPQWVYDLGNHFGLKPSTYPGHQETDRAEAGYARNPQLLNRGIDWAAPGTSDEVDRMQRLADYLLSIRGNLEQVIWENPRTGRRIGVAGGADVSAGSYFASEYPRHRNHVHSRQSKPIPLPGNAPAPAPTPPPVLARPQFTEIAMFGRGASKRSRPPINFFLHTEEGNGSAKSLAEYCQGQNGVSYHYTLRDRIVYDVVDTDLYSWSVLDANVFSINLCFAGSRAAFSRAQWLDREADIEIAAYLAVADCRKYGFSTEVLVPDWAKTGTNVYAGGPRAGISDHNYVTRELGIGNHTDVGPNFPWDVFSRYVAKYAGSPTQGDDDLSAEDSRKLDLILREIQQHHPSRSAVRNPNEGPVDTWAGMTLNTDGNVDLMATFLRGLAKHPGAIERLKKVAAGGEPGRPVDDAQLAQALLATLQDFWRLLQPGVVVAPAAALPTVVRTVGVESPIRTGNPADELLVGENGRLLEENTRLAAENARLAFENTRLVREAQLQDGLAGGAPTTITNIAAPAVDPFAEVPDYQPTTGDAAARLIDATEEYTRTARSMDKIQRAALAASLDVLGGVAWGPDDDDAAPKVETRGSE